LWLRRAVETEPAEVPDTAELLRRAVQEGPR
jgi:hypothetical protein